MSAWERMDAENHHLGLSPHWHPLRLLRPRLSPSWLTATDLDRAPHGMTVTLAGLVVCRQRPGTAKGITFLLLEDETGLVNVIVSRQLYETQRRLVRGVPFLVVKGRLEKQHGTINVVAAQLRELESVPAAMRQPPDDPTDTTEPTGELGGIDAHLRVPASHDYR
jgi:error-prone DNA polymerase